MQSFRNNPDSPECQQAAQEAEYPFLFPSAFPLRVEHTGDCWEIFTKRNESYGSLNNFAVCSGIQHEHEAKHICRVLNQAQGIAS